jgi:phage portal protein BeeE/2'-5' RNA ligase
MGFYDNRTIGRYARRTPEPDDSAPGYRRPEEPYILFFDGKSITPYSTKRQADLFTGYGVSAATLRPGKLGQNDWDFARAYVLCEYAFRCIEMVASDIAAIKHGVRNKKTKAEWPDHPLMKALAWARRTNYQDIISLWQKALYIWGENYLLPIENGFRNPDTGTPFYSGIQWLNPLVTEPYIPYGDLQGFDYRAYGLEHYSRSQIIFDKVGSVFDDLRGQSRISVALTAENIDIEIKRYTLDQFIKDMRMAGILTGRQGSNIGQPELDAALAKLKEQKESRLVALNSALEYQRVQNEFNDTQFKASDDARRRITTALGIPMSVVGAWDDAKYQSAPAQLSFYYDHVVFRECDRLTQFMNEVVMPYFDPWGGGEWFYDKDSVLTLIEDRQAKTNIINSQVTAGYRDLYSAAIESGVKEPPEALRNLYMVGGTPVPLVEMPNLWKAKLPPPGPLPPPPPVPALPAVMPPIDPTKDIIDDKSVCLLIAIGANQELISLQQRTKQLCAERGITDAKWNAPNEFHLTLAYSSVGNETQIPQMMEMLEALSWPDDMMLRVGRLQAFDNVGEYPIVFRVSKTGDLAELQESAYELFQDALLPTRAHYEPAQFKPHITMGYASKPLGSPIIYKGNTRVKPIALELHYGTQVVYSRDFVEEVDGQLEGVGLVEDETGQTEPPVETRPAPASKAALLFQADVGYTVKSPNLAQMCRNCRWFSDQPNTTPCNIVINAPLTIVEGGWCNRWEIIPDGSTVNAWIEDYSGSNPNLVPDLIPPDVMHELEELGETPNPEAAYLFTPQKGADLLKLPALVQGTVEDEIAAWEKKVKNGGAQKALTFKNYLIRDEIADGIRAALAEAADAEAVKAVFANACALIAYKAIQVTELDFQNAFDAVLEEARAGTLKRTRWSTITRSLIKTYANKAYRDGLEEGGVDDEPDATERAEIDAFVASQSEYVTGLGGKLFNEEDAISDALAEQKSAMWWKKSVFPMYTAGLTSANGNQMMEFVGSDGEKPCRQCEALKGQRHRAKEWKDKKLWPGEDTESFDCGGFNCAHTLAKVNGRARGNWV